MLIVKRETMYAKQREFDYRDKVGKQLACVLCGDITGSGDTFEEARCGNDEIANYYQG